MNSLSSIFIKVKKPIPTQTWVSGRAS